MRIKILSVLTVLLLLCGCAASGEVIPTLRGISFQADIAYYNENYICDTVIEADGKMTMTVTYPDNLGGLKLFFVNDNVTAEYMGLTYSPKNGSLPVGSVAQALHDIIATVEAHTDTVVHDGENCVAEGRYNDTYFKFHFSPAGLPLSVQIPDDSFKIQFNNLTVL